jgi:hypothetical protein
MRRALSAVGLGLFMISCGSSSTSTPTPVATPTPVPAMSAISLSVSPNPIIATPSGDPTFPNLAQWTLTITETAGLGCNVNEIIVTALDNGVQFFNFIVNPSDLIHSSGGFINGVVGTNHIAANGSLNVPLAIVYRLGSGLRQVTLSQAVQVIDDHGNQVNAANTVSIDAFQRINVGTEAAGRARRP